MTLIQRVYDSLADVRITVKDYRGVVQEHTMCLNEEYNRIEINLVKKEKMTYAKRESATSDASGGN